MADGVRKTVAFLATYVEELVRLQKPTLEAVLKSNRAKQVKEWKAAQNFWERKRQILTVEQQNLFEDWEFVLCEMSTLETVAFLPRLQRCFQRVESFVTEQGEALQKVGARNLQLALKSQDRSQCPMSSFAQVFLERYLESCTAEQKESIAVWEARFCQIGAEAQQRARRTCALAFARLQVFFSKFADKIVQLQKETLRDVVMSNQANSNVEWKQAQNFFARDVHLLTVEERDLLEDWELVLCEMSTLETVAFLPRLQRCFQRVESFFTEQGGALQKVGARNLQLALRSPHMLQFPTATFARVFLERYLESFTPEQSEVISVWEAQLCQISAEAQERARRSCAQAFLRLQEFFAKFAKDILDLQKENLRDVVMSNQANSNVEWKQAQNFFARDVHLLTVEERDLLEDWELVLCEMSTLETVAFLPRLQRCFQRVESFFTEQGGALQKVGARNLQLALRSPHMLQFPTSTFARVFLERYLERFTPEQSEVISVWEAQLCQISAEAQERARRSCAQAFLRLQEFFAKFAKDILDLQKENLRDVVMSNQAHSHAEWWHAQTFFRRQHPLLTVEEKDLLEDWELVLCEVSTLEAVAFLPCLQRCFARVQRFMTECRDELKAQNKKDLVNILQSKDMESRPMSSFCGVFLTRYLHRLSEEQLAVVAQWERELCVSETELVEKFLEMLGRREADLKMLGASSVEQLFSGHSKKTDEDLRFGYDFVRRQWSQLAPADQERIRKALEPLIHKVEQMPVKEFHDAKLHAGETVLGDQLPRPRLPKSLRQLYGNSMDAEARIMPFFHRVHEVDAYMLDMEFQDCAYCKEGWFGIATGRGKSRLPGGFESQAFQKTNFCRAPEKEWLEPGKPICENCLHEAKERAKAQLPKEPFRLTAANHADPGDSLPETDALTFFEEEILSPIQHLVRIFTLYGTGQCELRGHVGNLFQNGPQFVRDIPAAVGDMKMLLIRRCNKDPHRKQRVPFLASRLRLERALNRLCRPVDEGGSVALRPGGLTPEGYVGFVNRDNLEQYANTEEGAEPEGLEVQEVQQQIWKRIEKKLFAMWLSTRLELQLASKVRALHEPQESESDADRTQKTWDSLRQKLDELNLEVGGPEDVVTASLVGYLVFAQVYVSVDGSCGERSVLSDDRMQQGSVGADDPMTTGGAATERKHLSHDQVEQILHDELTAVQEVAAWEDQPLVAEGFWSPEDLSAQQTQHEMHEDLWSALQDAHRSDALTAANLKRHGAGRVEGLPIVDPPTVLSRNQLIREDHPYYIAAGFLKLFPLGHGDYWAHVQDRADNDQPLSFWEWVKHLLLRSDGRFQAHPRFYFFALNTALRNKALRARTYFVKRQVGLNTSDSYTNEELMNMGKAQFTKIIAAFEQAMIGSAQEKLQQRSDLEALVEQIEQETLEQKAEEVLGVWQAAVQTGKEVLAEGSEEFGNWKNKCEAAEEVLERLLGSEAEAVEVLFY